MNPLFEDSNEYDAKDLVNFIITTLHEELNKANKFNNNNKDIVLDQRNQQIMFNNFGQTFQAENQSIISDIFFGINYNVIQCWGCNSRIYNYQTYFFLEFPLEEIFKFVKSNNHNNDFNNSINIYDCFEYDRKINPTYGDNTIICNYCKKKCNFIMSTYLATGPEILILSLERGDEIDIKFNFTEELNLYNYIDFKNTGYNYELIGVITNEDKNSVSYFAYCRDPISYKWHKYKDDIVTDVNSFQNEVINYVAPCLLFYQKIN